MACIPFGEAAAMLRKIIQIDPELCNGCELCVSACHEGAIGMKDGKARLLRDEYCDGLGDCLPACPTGAITFVTREADAYDEAAVLAHMAHSGRSAADIAAAAVAAEVAQDRRSFGCPGSRTETFDPIEPVEEAVFGHSIRPSQIASWPIEIKLVSIQADYFDGADLLVAADCTAFAYGDFHRDFMAGKITVIGCPKLDGVDYADKLSAIFKSNDIQSITVARMEVPCCGGLESAVRRAIEESGKDIPLEVVTISRTGIIL